MKKVLLLLIACFPFICFAQNTYIIEAPVGLLRNEPTLTAPIIHKIGEKEKVIIVEKLNGSWSKIEYHHNNTVVTGYITTHNLTEYMPAKEELIATTSKGAKN